MADFFAVEELAPALPWLPSSSRSFVLAPAGELFPMRGFIFVNACPKAKKKRPLSAVSSR